MQSELTPVLAPVRALAMPDTVALGEGASKLMRFAEACTITDDEGYQLAGADLQAVKKRWGAIEDMRTAITGPLNTALKAVNALFKPPLDALAGAETVYKRKMIAYSLEQARLAALERVEAERKAQEARLSAEQESMRLAAEARALEAAGNVAMAAERAAEAQAAESVAAVTIAAPVREVVKAAGITVRKTVDFDVDLAKLVIGVASNLAEHPEWMAYLQAADVAIRAQVRATGMATRIPGVRVFEKDGITAR